MVVVLDVRIENTLQNPRRRGRSKPPNLQEGLRKWSEALEVVGRGMAFSICDIEKRYWIAGATNLSNLPIYSRGFEKGVVLKDHTSRWSDSYRLATRLRVAGAVG